MIETLKTRFTIKLSDEISDAADAVDADELGRKLEAAVIDIVTRGVARGYRPVGDIKVTLEQKVKV